MIRAPQEPLPSAERVSEVLRDILADPDFATFEASVRQQVIEWLLRRAGELWNWIQGLVGEGGAGVVQTVVVVVALAALAVMATVAARHRSRLKAAERSEEEPEPEAPRTAREWLATADRRARGGAFRPAATALYQGFLLTLERQGALSFHGSKTPGDYATEIVRGGGGARGGGTGGGGEGMGAVGGAAAGGRFLASFQRFSFGQGEPTAGGYARLARAARDAGCPVAGPAGAERAGRDSGAAPAAASEAEAGTASEAADA